MDAMVLLRVPTLVNGEGAEWGGWVTNSSSYGASSVGKVMCLMD